jgi:hypothetical protein
VVPQVATLVTVGRHDRPDLSTLRLAAFSPQSRRNGSGGAAFCALPDPTPLLASSRVESGDTPSVRHLFCRRPPR